MASLALTAARFPWTRAALVLAATLLAHAWIFDRVRQVLGGDLRQPAFDTAPLSARLLPPPPVPAPPVPAPPPAPRQQAVRQSLAAQGRGATPPVVAAPEARAEAAAAEPVVASPAAEASDESTAASPPPAVMNAERPVERDTPAEALVFEATGEALRDALAALPAPGAALPSAGHYVYRTSNSDLRLVTGTTTVDWSLAGDGRYRLRLATTTAGLTVLELQSEGSVLPFGLAPDRYTETRVRRATVAANFDWAGRRVTFSARTHERPLPDGAQDRISFQFQLMLLGQARPEWFRSGAQTVLQVAGRDDVVRYRLRSTGSERTETGLGELDTVRIERVVEAEGDARIEIWLAPEHGWVPARLRFTDRHGRVTESVLESAARP